MFDNVLLKLNQIQDLTSEERLKYGKQLEYINQKSESINYLNKNFPKIDEKVKNLHQEVNDIHKFLEIQNQQKNKLYSSIQRLEKISNDSINLKNDLELTWNKLLDIDRLYFKKKEHE